MESESDVQDIEKWCALKVKLKVTSMETESDQWWAIEVKVMDMESESDEHRKNESDLHEQWKWCFVQGNLEMTLMNHGGIV